ncbi:RNA polymerase sigma-I factor [Cohnella faecalis]|uniref:RNA polymerase sigma factor SigI n=1 Tax=Cohnella faecalis TaxID=2315694 RepID=A0A398CMH7_9BACL|nr:RNA polymerase sigma-I factor [Cohnella faecalis]RIE03665.1 RNA polymerase sigma-I factor [Cohnella faecalis]
MLLLLWRKWFPLEEDGVRKDDGSPESMVAAIQAGDDGLRNELIAKYKPYIAKTASRFSRRFIDPERDDEFSVALAAFNEAISSFSPDGGRRFLGFSEKVITRRLIDYARQEGRHSASIPYSAVAGNGSEGADKLDKVEAVQALEVYEQQREAEERRTEIVALQQQLDAYGIGFPELTEQSPRHADSRRALLKLAGLLAQSDPLFEKLADKKQLPVKELCETGNVSRKTVERHRKYIITVALIARGPFPFLKEYIGMNRGGEEGI